MKKNVLPCFIGTFLILFAGLQHTVAQVNKTATISITITEGDKVTTDTTFELKKGQDPEMIKKMVTQLAGGDMHVKHMSQDVYIARKGDSDEDRHTNPCMEKINIDSIKGAHEGARLLVIKNKDGDVTVEELEEDVSKEHMIIIQTDVDDDCKGLEQEIKVIVSGDEGDEDLEVFVLKQDDGEEVKVVQKKVRVVIEDEGDDKEKAVKKERKK